MKINPCMHCKKHGWWKEEKYPTFRNGNFTEYYAECHQCGKKTNAANTLEEASKIWNKINTSPQEKAKEAWDYINHRGINWLFKLEDSVITSDYIKENIKILKEKREILDEFFNTGEAEFKEAKE